MTTTGKHTAGPTTAAGARTAERLLECIEEEAAEKFRFADDQCWNCGGDGYVYSCFEEYACGDPESGCEGCAQRCPECASLKRDRLRYVRETVIQSNDTELAKVWLKSVGRWSNEYTDAQIQSEMLKAAALSKAKGGRGMSKIDDGGAAFPSHAGDPEATDPRNRISCGGLTKREYFAAAALTGAMTSATNLGAMGCDDRRQIFDRTAALIFEMADALIAASKEADHD